MAEFNYESIAPPPIEGVTVQNTELGCIIRWNLQPRDVQAAVYIGATDTIEWGPGGPTNLTYLTKTYADNIYVEPPINSGFVHMIALNANWTNWSAFSAPVAFQKLGVVTPAKLDLSATNSWDKLVITADGLDTATFGRNIPIGTLVTVKSVISGDGQTKVIEGVNDTFRLKVIKNGTYIVTFEHPDYETYTTLIEGINEGGSSGGGITGNEWSATSLLADGVELVSYGPNVPNPSTAKAIGLVNGETVVIERNVTDGTYIFGPTTDAGTYVITISQYGNTIAQQEIIAIDASGGQLIFTDNNFWSTLANWPNESWMFGTNLPNPTHVETKLLGSFETIYYEVTTGSFIFTPSVSGTHQIKFTADGYQTYVTTKVKASTSSLFSRTVTALPSSSSTVTMQKIYEPAEFTPLLLHMNATGDQPYVWTDEGGHTVTSTSTPHAQILVDKHLYGNGAGKFIDTGAGQLYVAGTGADFNWTTTQYATFSPTDKGDQLALSNGDLTVTSTSATVDAIRTTFPVSSGKWYAEFTPVNIKWSQIGVGNANALINDPANSFTYTDDGLGIVFTGNILKNNSVVGYVFPYEVGDTVCIAVDMDAREVSFKVKNSSSWVTMSGSNVPTGDLYLMFGGTNQGSNTGATLNTGQSPFAYTVKAGHNAGFYQSSGGGSQDFTVETYLYPTVSGSEQTIFDTRADNTGSGLNIRIYNNELRAYLGNTLIISGAGAITYNQWQHIAISRKGNDTRLYAGGNQIGSTYSTPFDMTCAANRPLIGSNAAGSQWFNGWMDEFRISKRSRYFESTYVVPTEPFGQPFIPTAEYAAIGTGTGIASNKRKLKQKFGMDFDIYTGGFIRTPGSIIPAYTHGVLAGSIATATPIQISAPITELEGGTGQTPTPIQLNMLLTTTA